MGVADARNAPSACHGDESSSIPILLPAWRPDMDLGQRIATTGNTRQFAWTGAGLREKILELFVEYRKVNT
jgi:hypothetical protein